MSMDCQASSYLMDVLQQFGVGISVSRRLTIDQDPIFRDPSAINTVFELEGHTPMLLIIVEEEIGIVIFVIITLSIK